LTEPRKGNALTNAATLTPHQSQYYARLLTRRTAGNSVEDLAATLVDSQVAINPHQVDAALFACKNPLSKGVILADEVPAKWRRTLPIFIGICWYWTIKKKRHVVFHMPLV
jgi:hypothetical protein